MKVSFIPSTFQKPYERRRIEVLDDDGSATLLTAGCDRYAMKTALDHLRVYYGLDAENAALALAAAAFEVAAELEEETEGRDDAAPFELADEQGECHHEWIEAEGEPPYDVCTHCGEVRR